MVKKNKKKKKRKEKIKKIVVGTFSKSRDVISSSTQSLDVTMVAANASFNSSIMPNIL